VLLSACRVVQLHDARRTRARARARMYARRAPSLIVCAHTRALSRPLHAPAGKKTAAGSSGTRGGRASRRGASSATAPARAPRGKKAAVDEAGAEGGGDASPPAVAKPPKSKPLCHVRARMRSLPIECVLLLFSPKRPSVACMLECVLFLWYVFFYYTLPRASPLSRAC